METKGMHDGKIVVSEKGKMLELPAIKLENVTITTKGRAFRIAQIHDEVWQGRANMPEPLEVIDKLRSMKNRPDVFTFAQRLPDVRPQYAYPIEWENVAAASTDSYAVWFEKEVNRSVRKHVRKAEREGIVTKVVSFDDNFVEGICSIYNETEVRQGKKFWHYGKSLEQVKRENGTYRDRSIFIGAYFGEELVGFLKFVVDAEVGNMMQILAKVAHFPKRPTNALIAKAVEVCAERKIKFLIYGEHTYGKQKESSLIDFKEKNGFRKVDLPRYYVPLTAKGYVAVRFGVHKGWMNFVPGWVTTNLVAARSKYHAWRLDNSRALRGTD